MSLLDKTIRGEPIRQYLWPSKNQYRTSDRTLFIIIGSAAVILGLTFILGIVSTMTHHPSIGKVPVISTKGPTTTIPLSSSAAIPPAAQKILLEGASATITGQWSHVPLLSTTPAPTTPTANNIAVVPTIQRILLSTPASVVARVGLSYNGITSTVSSTVEYKHQQWYYVPG